MTIITNPLTTFKDLPPFSKIKAEHMKPALQQAIENSKSEVERVLLNNNNPTWDNLIAPIQEAENKLNIIWSPISHMNAVVNNDEIRIAHDSCLALLSDYSTWKGQHKELYHAYKALKASPSYEQLKQEQKKTIINGLRDFELSGIGLSAEKQKRYGEISSRLSELNSKFTNNVLDATMAWSKHITDKTELAGLPESALDAAAQTAKEKNLDGYLLTLDVPCFLAVRAYCDNAELRKEICLAYNTRASEVGPNAKEFDNSEIIEETMQLRHELAKLLGFKNYSEYSVATKMAESPAQVLDFLNSLADKANPQSKKEIAELSKFAKEKFNVDKINIWDFYYYAEKQKEHLFDFSDEDLKAYFPEHKAVNGLFEVLNRVFNVTIKERQGVDVWHKDVKFFDIFDKENNLCGSFYFDLYARNHKRGGAWMNECKVRHLDKTGNIQTPVAYLTCNFSKPVGDKPALFTHNELTTLFHETGHGIHHMLTKVNVSDVSGINGVPWDAVEQPSQFLENWCWQEEALAFISGHYETGEALPTEMLNKMLEAKNFLSGMFVLRQLRFGLLDMNLHTYYNPEQGAKVTEVLTEVDKITNVLPAVESDRMPFAFSHIFAGGYSAGYYSYLWAEVLSADAFSRFEEDGIFNKQTGQDFLDTVLGLGGSEEPMELFKRFRGREPKIDALLRHKGINA